MYQYKETVLNKPSNELGIPALSLSLPLPQLSGLNGRYSQKITESTDVEDRYFLDHVATAGGVLNRHHAPETIGWRVLQKHKVLELEVLDLEGRSSTATRKIRIESSLQFRANCVTVTDDRTDHAVVVDFITINGFLYTVKVPVSEFEARKPTQLTNRNSKEWRGIKSPYSFDLKPPHTMHAVDSNTLIVSLQDGGLIRLDRDGALDTVTTTTFADSHGMGISRLLPWNYSDKVPGRTDLSVRTAVSLASNAEKRLVAAVSINRQLRVWDLETSTSVAQVDIDGGSGKSEQLLDPTPSRLITFCGDFIAVYRPLDDGSFTIWRCGSDKSLEKVFSIDAALPDKTAVWVVADIQLAQQNANSLTLWVVWKSDTSSQVQCLDVGNQSTDWVLTYPGDQSIFSEKFAKVDSREESEYFVEKIFGPGGISLQTLKTALPIYAQHFSLEYDSSVDLSTVGKLRKAVCATVGAAVSMSSDSNGNSDYKAYQQDLSLQWTRFERLCLELEKQGHEAMALSVSRKDGAAYLVKASFSGIIRPLSVIELFYYNKSTSPNRQLVPRVAAAARKGNSQLSSVLNDDMAESLLKLLDFLYRFRTSISHAVSASLHCSLREDYMKIRHNFSTAERIEEYYQEHFAPHVTDYSIGVLSTQLAELDELESVLNVVHALVSDSESAVPSTHKTSYGAQFLSKILFEQANVAQQTTLDVLSLIIISVSCGDDIVLEQTTSFARHLAQLRSVSCVLSALNVSGNSAETFVERLIRENPAVGVANIWVQFTGSISAANIAVQLHKHDYQAACREHLAEFVGTDYFSSLVRGLLLEDEHWICKAAVGASKYSPFSPSRMAVIENISPLIIIGQSSLPAFYASVATYLASSNPYLALRLAKLAAVSKGSTHATSALWFDLAIKARVFDDAYTALMHLPSPTADQVAAFVDAILAAGEARRLVQYPFIGLTHHVSAHLESRGERKVLYSWRIERGDVRGAAAALYDELHHLRSTSSHSQPELLDESTDAVRDLYELLLNALQLLGANDRWIVVAASEDEVGEESRAKRSRTMDGSDKGYRQVRRAVQYTQLLDEYTAYVKGLEAQLRNLVL